MKENINQAIKEIINDHSHYSSYENEYKEPTIDELKRKEPFCPLCGCEVKIKISFKGRSIYRAKRKTQYCIACDWACILPINKEVI